MKGFIILAVVACLAGCKGATKYDSTDSVEFAEFGAYPLDAVEDLEPVYIDLNDTADYHIGDTIEVNENGRIPYMGMPIRDGETNQLIKPKGWHWVVLDYRDKVNKTFSRDDAESNQ